MKKISWVTHSQYDIPLPKNHRFTSSKFSDLYKELKKRDFYKNAIIIKPDKASVNDLEMVHDREYILKIRDGTLSEKEKRRLGFKWSKILSNRSNIMRK